MSSERWIVRYEEEKARAERYREALEEIAQGKTALSHEEVARRALADSLAEGEER